MNIDIFIGILIGISIATVVALVIFITHAIWSSQENRIADIAKRLKKVEKIVQIKSVTIEDAK